MAILTTLVGRSLVFPHVVYDDFVWYYFWGPVQADANSAVCTVRASGVTQYLDTASTCTTAAEFVTYPGRTLVSEVGYMVTLIIALSGVMFLFRRLDIGGHPRFLYALFPFMLLDGMFRIVEGANDAPGITDTLIVYPLSTPAISPVIHVTVFTITSVAVAGSVLVERRGLADDYVKPLFGADLAILVVALGYLLWVGLTGVQGVTFYLRVLVVIPVGVTSTAVATWWLAERFTLEVNKGAGYTGLVVTWGHAISGVADVTGLDWIIGLGARHNLIPKHPVNQVVVDLTSSTFPESVLVITDDVWPSLFAKLVAATAVVWMFDEQIFEDSPRYAILLLIVVPVVGLGSGSRDMLRVTFGV